MSNIRTHHYTIPFAREGKVPGTIECIRRCTDRLKEMYPGTPPSDVLKRVLEEYSTIQSSGTGEVFVMLENMMDTLGIKPCEIIPPFVSRSVVLG